jgi:hypothetical protein
MEFNRNQYFLAGLVTVMLGIQLRLVETFVLNDRASQFIARRMQQIKGQQVVASAGELPTLFASSTPVVRERVHPPQWIGWSLASVGSVLVLYSLALKKPGG